MRQWSTMLIDFVLGIVSMFASRWALGYALLLFGLTRDPFGVPLEPMFAVGLAILFTIWGFPIALGQWREQEGGCFWCVAIGCLMAWLLVAPRELFYLARLFWTCMGLYLILVAVVVGLIILSQAVSARQRRLLTNGREIPPEAS